MRVCRAVVVLTCFAVLAATLGWGQGIVTGSISGTVVDQQKAVVANAKVTAVHLETNRDFATVTTAAGLFTFGSLPIGTYTVTVEAPGFQKLQIKDVVVQVGKDAGLGARELAVGKGAEVVTVEGAAPLVDTTTSQIQATFDFKKVNNIPTTGGFDTLAYYVPGVASTGSAGAFGNTNGASISANGQRSRSNNFQIDGQNNNDTSVTGPSIFIGNPDIIAEYQVVTQYTAEYGRNTGAVVNYVTKSGTNAFHGSAFEYLNNSAFWSMSNTDKNPLYSNYCIPFANGSTKWPANPQAAGCAIPQVAKDIDNRYGGTIGGPIKKDKAWFFGSYMEEKERWAGSVSSSSPGVTVTPNGIAALKAAFPNSPGVAALAALGPQAITAGNPAFNPVGFDTVKTAAGVSVPVEVGTVSRNVPGYYNDRELSGRVDYQLTEKDRLLGRYFYQSNNTVGNYAGIGFANGDWADVPAKDQQFGLEWVRTINTRLTNQARISYTRINFGWNGGSAPDCTMANITGCAPEIDMSGTTAGGQSYISFGRYTSYPQGRINNYYQLQDNGSWLVGRHTFKFGGEFAVQRNPSVFLPYYNGLWTFGSLQGLVDNAPSGARVTDGPPKMYFNTHDYAAYFQDDFHVRPNLTLQLGVRWEMYAQATNNLHDMTVARQTGPNPFWDPNLPLSRTTVPYVSPATKNFSPVLGFAWNPQTKLPRLAQNSTTIRGGFRIAYDAAFYNMFSNVYGGAPVVNQASWLSGVIPGLPNVTDWTGAAIRPYLVALAPHGAGVDPGARTQSTVASDFHNPYSQQWNIGVEQMIGTRMAAEIRYVGSHSIDLYQTINGNPSLAPFISNGYSWMIPAGMTPCADKTMPGYAGGYPDCTRTNVNVRGNYGVAKYNALQTRYNIRNWRNLSFDATYTYSSNRDNSSETYDATAVGSLSVNPNPFSPHTLRDWGISAIDFPHVASVVMNYSVPFHKDQSGVLGKLLGGWELNTTWRYASGAPWTPYSTKNSNTKTTTSFCDPGNLRSTSTGADMCRPALLNAGAPIDSVAYLVQSGTAYSVYNFKGRALVGDTSTLNQFHWLIVNPAAINFYGKAPWDLATFRDIVRGDTINNPNLAIYKTFKVTERVSTQFQTQVFNILNRQYRGTPGASFGSSSETASFGNTFYRSSGYGQAATMENGVGRRAVQFALKVNF